MKGSDWQWERRDEYSLWRFCISAISWFLSAAPGADLLE